MRGRGCLTIGIGNVRSSGSTTSLTDSWHGNLNFRRLIYFLSGFCFRSEFYFRNNIYSTTFPCAWPGDHGGGRSTRFISLERVTTGGGSVSRAAIGENKLARHITATYVTGRVGFHDFLLENTPKLLVTSFEIDGTGYRSKQLKYNCYGKQNATLIQHLERGKTDQKWELLLPYPKWR